jgi:3-phenylpropionate/trans-cinnamate dioxygenase ferredoxin reductase component
MAGYENVIVGGGLSGGMVAQEYREAAGQGSVLIVAGEPHAPYHRPPLTKEYLRREKGLDDVYMHPAEWWAGQDVDLRLNTEVTAIDAAGHSIGITGGERIEFERLVLATGSTPRPLAGAQTIRRIEDSDALADVLQRGEGHVVVLGGGFIGVEAAASARMKGLEVTLVMQNQVVWDHLFGEQVGQYFHRHLEEHGVRILSGRDGLPEGLAERADVVVAGIGVTPNIDLASAAGLDTDTGVLVDEHLRAADGIWAVGDIAEYQSVIHGRRIRIEHWDVALNQGKYVGAAWAGKGDGPYDVVPYFFSDLADWTWMEYVGPGEGEVEIRGSMAEDDFVAYWTDDRGRLTAALGVNRSDEVEQAKALIREGGKKP